MEARRIGCLWLPQFSVGILRRQRPALQGRALIVGGTLSEARRTVRAFSDEARLTGVRIGMPLREAQLRCPDAVFLPADDAAEQEAQEQILSLLDAFSPTVESVRPGVVLFDAAGLERHYPSEAALATEVAARVTEQLTLPARVGLAGTRFCARVASAYASPVRIVSPGGEREFLAPLPVQHLPDLEAWSWRLQFLGIRTIGDYAARLPYNDVVTRYGPEAAQAHLLARGLDPTPVQPERRLEPPMASQRFDQPEERLEPLVFALKRHLDRLCADLERDGWLSGRVALRCVCDGADDVTLTVRPAEPSSSAARLRDLLRWTIERRGLAAQQAGRSLFGGGITLFELRLEGLTPAVGQALDLFSGGRAGQRNVLGAIERLEALLGPESVRQAVPGKGRRPDEAFTWAPYRPPAIAPRRSAGRGRRAPVAPTIPASLPQAVVADGRPSLSDPPLNAGAGPALRLFDPPLPVQVRERDGAVVALLAGRGAEAVVTFGGPWRLDERWWADRTAARDYYQVATRAGRVYLLYHEADAWFVQGVFD